MQPGVVPSESPVVDPGTAVHTGQRRMERALIAGYEADMDRLMQTGMTPATREIASSSWRNVQDRSR